MPPALVHTAFLLPVLPHCVPLVATAHGGIMHWHMTLSDCFRLQAPHTSPLLASPRARSRCRCSFAVRGCNSAGNVIERRPELLRWCLRHRQLSSLSSSASSLSSPPYVAIIVIVIVSIVGMIGYSCYSCICCLHTSVPMSTVCAALVRCLCVAPFAQLCAALLHAPAVALLAAYSQPYLLRSATAHLLPCLLRCRWSYLLRWAAAQQLRCRWSHVVAQRVPVSGPVCVPKGLYDQFRNTSSRTA